jgi:adenylate cyclase
MALFGVPKPANDPAIDATNAVLAALDIVQNIAHIGPRDLDTARKPFQVRIGINTGKVLAGNIGSKSRINYTVIGEPVNTASRIENAARDFLNGEPGCILISQATYKEVKAALDGKITFKPQGPVRLKGNETLHLYKVSHG